MVYLRYFVLFRWPIPFLKPLMAKQPAPITLRQLSPQDEHALAIFLESLKPKTLHLWNRFGTRISIEAAHKIAAGQVRKSVDQEKGFIAIVRNEIVGYSYLRFFPEKPQKKGTASLGLVVQDDFQGMGIGSKLMMAMIEYAKDKKMIKIWLSTYADNKMTRHFYKPFGFLREGIFMFDEYFGKKPRHVISMAKFLDPKLAREALKIKKKQLVD